MTTHMGSSASWNPIMSAPENTDILVYCPDDNDHHYYVDRYKLVITVHDDLVKETDRQKIYEKRTERRREWDRSWCAEWWMPLPDSPE